MRCSLYFLSVLFLSACVRETTDSSNYRLLVREQPLQIVVRVGDRDLVRQHAPDTALSSIYYLTAAGVQYLTEPVRLESDGVRLEAEYHTTDNRRALIRIRPQPHGGPRIEISFDPSEDILGVGEVLAARATEHFHGLSERVLGNHDDVPRDPTIPVALDRRGHVVEMNTRGTISLYAPFYLSSAGYGLHVEDTWLGTFDMAASDSTRVRFFFTGPSLAYQIFVGGTPERILEQYTAVVGRPFLPPEWGLGHFRWRDNHEHRDTLFDGTRYVGPFNSMVYEDIVMTEKLDIPLDVYWVDRPWAKGPRGYDDFEWDPERFPNAVQMIQWLQQKGIRFMVWLAPWVHGQMAWEALERSYFLPAIGMVSLGIKRASMLQDSVFVMQQLKPRIKEAIMRMPEGLVRLGVARYLTENAGHYVALYASSGERQALRERYSVAEGRRALMRAVDRCTTLQQLRPFAAILDGGRVLIDFTNPEATSWWQSHLRKLLEQGVVGFKLDRAEEIVPDDRDVVAWNGMSMAQLHNRYPVLYAKAVHDVAAGYREDFVVMPRAGYPGSQRYAVFWCGDIRATWIGLRNAVIAAQRAALMGYPIWTCDTGGYWGGVTTGELMMRWLGFSAFNPFMDIGPLNDRAPWDMPDGSGYNEEVIAAYRTYVLLHKRLHAYTYRYAEEAHRLGHPIIRPLFYEYPEDSRAWEIWDEFMYGEDILVAPVLQEGVRGREVYLPAGEWRDYWRPDSVYRGPLTLKVSAPVYKTPIFVRATSEVPLVDLDALYQESLEIARQRPKPGNGSEINF